MGRSIIAYRGQEYRRKHQGNCEGSNQLKNLGCRCKGEVPVWYGNHGVTFHEVRIAKFTRHSHCPHLHPYEEAEDEHRRPPVQYKLGSHQAMGFMPHGVGGQLHRAADL